MESSFLFFLVGLAIYLVKRFLGEKNPNIQHIAFMVTGFISAAIITSLAGVPWPHEQALPFSSCQSLALWGASSSTMRTVPSLSLNQALKISRHFSWD